MKTKTAVLVNNVWFKYPRSNWILRGINFSIREGEKILIMGRSGCGKSTLLHLISGLYPYLMKGTLCGDIRVFGISAINGLHKLRNYLGILLQNFEHELLGLTVEEEILIDSLNRGVPLDVAKKHSEELLKIFKLDRYRKRLSLRLSFGEKQRVVLSAILLANPRILILDEPFSQIDTENAQILINFLKMLKNRTIIVSEHKITRVLSFANRVLVMDKGSIIYDGVPSDKLRRYCEFPKLVRKNKKIGGKVLTARNLMCGYTKPLVYVKFLELHKGEILAITGPNGSGKTTLGMTLAGIISPISGEIYKNGRVCYVFQNPINNLVYKTVWDEIFIPARRFSTDPYKITNDLIESFGLNGKENQNPFTLSIGEKMRLAIASSIASNPAVIIIDEPTFGQDVKNLVTIVEKLRDYSSSNRNKFGVIILTYDEDFARKISDVCININSLKTIARE